MSDNRQSIIIEHERLQMLRQLANVSRSLQQTMAELQNIEELQPIPADLGDITTTWLQQRIDECTAPIKADKSLTVNERRERLKPWRAINQRATRLVGIIEGILQTNTDVVFTVSDDNGRPHYSISEQQIEAVALQRATHDIPPEAIVHCELIQEVRAKVDELREFERAHNVKRYNIEQLLGLPWICGIADLWVTGDILKNPLTEKWRNYFPGQKLERNFTTRLTNKEQ